jgi:hypothetical protein
MNKRIIPRPVRELPRTKEQFMIEWVLLRASFREDFTGTAAAQTAADTWDTIQKLKGKK